MGDGSKVNAWFYLKGNGLCGVGLWIITWTGPGFFLFIGLDLEFWFSIGSIWFLSVKSPRT